MTFDPVGGPWTSHGHPIPGVTVYPADHRFRPPVMRCGGVKLCRTCREEAAEIVAQETGA